MSTVHRYLPLILSVGTLWVAGVVPVAGQGCKALETGSRWVAAALNARPTHTYGSGETWIATLAGVATVPGKVLLFDEGKPSVSVLSPTLEPLREFGRAGAGPGEISGGMNLQLIGELSDYNLLGGDGSRTVLFDRREIEVYDSLGTPRYSVRFAPSDSWLYGLRHVQPFGDSALIAVVDSVDFTGRRPRRLQAWAITGSSPSHAQRLLWEFAVPGHSGAALTSRTRRESRPFWGRIDGCQVASDGASRYLFRYDEQTGRADSLMLPDWRIPGWGRHAGDRSRLNIGGRIAQQPRPASLARWSDLVVDPDGWAWVRAWTEEPTEVRVFAVSLGSGQIVEVQPPAFPRAFGEPGVFYSTTRNPETREVLLLRYEGRIQ